MPTTPCCGDAVPTVRAAGSLARLFRDRVQGTSWPRVSFGDQLIRVYRTGGQYRLATFSYVQNREPKTLPARYSFTYVQNGDRWLIVDRIPRPYPGAEIAVHGVGKAPGASDGRCGAVVVLGALPDLFRARVRSWPSRRR